MPIPEAGELLIGRPVAERAGAMPVGARMSLGGMTLAIEDDPLRPMAEDDPDRYTRFSLPGDVIRKTHDGKTHEIHLDSEITPAHYDQEAKALDDYLAERGLPRLHAKAARLARDLTGELRARLHCESEDGPYDAAIEEFSSTGKGGGVQMILMSQGNYWQKSGINWHWRLLDKMDQIATRTKGWHNTFQGVRNPSIADLEESFAKYEPWAEERAYELQEPLSTARIRRWHDPQPHGLIKYAKEWNPNAIDAGWSHIQNRTDLIAQPGSPQEYLWNRMYGSGWNKLDAVSFHPVQSFVPESVPDEQVLFTPATFDPFDDLNRRNLTEQESQNGRNFLDWRLEMSAELKVENSCAKAETDWSQTGIDWNRPIAALIARFDPAKGMEVAMEAYAQARERMLSQSIPEEEIPQLVLVGNGAPDDTDGEAELARIMELRDSERYAAMKQDIKVGRVPHNDTALNVLMNEAAFGLQSSLYEGFETRASDWIWHSKPVIVSSRGGLPLQVSEGKSGYVADPANITEWANHIYDLSTDKQQYTAMCQWADVLGKSYNYLEFSTISNVIRQTQLYLELLDGTFQGSRNRPWRVQDILELAA